jgi:anti-sigma B factor antagonist
MSQLDVDVKGHDDHAVVRVAGEVDYFTSETFRDALDAASGAHSRLVLDLLGVGFMDSAGLGELVRVWKKVSPNGGRLAVVCTSNNVLKLFSITGLDQMVEIYDTVDAATART